jgi:AraC-like DNA-binding protein
MANPPNRAVWIPPGVVHCFSGRFAERGHAVCASLIYVAPDASASLPRDCRIIEVSALLRELISAAVDIPLQYDEASREGRVMGLIVDEVCNAPTLERSLPAPADPRLQRICEALIASPGNDGTLEYWARYGAIGQRTLTRLFREETGMTFAMWRQQLRLTEALKRLSAGVPVMNIALDLGYESPSAFTAMFRRVTGHTPKSLTPSASAAPISPQRP